MRKDIIAKVVRYYKDRLEFYNSIREKDLKKAMNDQEVKALDTKIKEIKTLALQGKLTKDKDKEYANVIKEYNKAISKYLTKINYACDICKDRGIINNKYCSCFMNRYMQEMKGLSNQTSLPNFRFEDSNFDKFKLPKKDRTSYDKLYALMQKYTAKYPNVKLRNIAITGSVGCGKTCLVSAISNRLMENNFTVLFFTSFELGELMKKAHLDYQNTSLKMVTDVDILVIDDLGSEPMRNNINNAYLQAILDSRLTHDKSTFITTNYTSEQLMNKYGERIVSRILDDSLKLDMGSLPNLRTTELKKQK